jgi:hypothetical protein
LGLAWFLAGAFIGLIVFEGLVDPGGKIADIWPAVLGYPGFFGGVAFFALTRILERGQRFDEVSLTRAAIWGALSGPLLMALFLLAIKMDLADFRGGQTPWLALAKTTGLMIPAFAILGGFSVWMARQVTAASGTRSEVGRTS